MFKVDKVNFKKMKKLLIIALVLFPAGLWAQILVNKQ